jgi:hypothetical protein
MLDLIVKIHNGVQYVYWTYIYPQVQMKHGIDSTNPNLQGIVS